jgi:hypothetical protein
MLFFDVGLLALLAPDPLQLFGGVVGLLGAFVLVIVGILVIVLIVGALLVLLPAIIVAIVVWFFTGSFFFAGIAFLIVAIISIIAV